MIPDFNTYIGESVWADIHRRSNGEQIRKEDESELYRAFQKIKKMDLIDMSSDKYTGKKVLFTPCNFGAEHPNEPGLYLNSEQIMQLHKMLKDTGYSITKEYDWKQLEDAKHELKYINKYWTFVFKKDSHTLYIPNFGCVDDVHTKPLYTSIGYHFIYGGIMFGSPISFKMTYESDMQYIGFDRTADFLSYQVRLVKHI